MTTSLECAKTDGRPRHFHPAEFGLGVLVPVVGGHPGSGASGVALALADAAAAVGLNTLLIDGADPARSGLADVWTARLRSDPPCRDGAVIVTTRRAKVMGRELASQGRPLAARTFPFLTEWADETFVRQYGPFDVTVVDVGWNAWTGFDEVRFGPMAWLGASAAASMPLMVAQPTAPSLRLTAGVHARWSAALAVGAVEGSAHLVLTNACSIPVSVTARTPASVADLVADAWLMPRDNNAQFAGWSLNPLPPASLSAATRILARAPERIAARVPSPHRTSSRFRYFPKDN